MCSNEADCKNEDIDAGNEEWMYCGSVFSVLECLGYGLDCGDAVPMLYVDAGLPHVLLLWRYVLEIKIEYTLQVFRS